VGVWGGGVGGVGGGGGEGLGFWVCFLGLGFLGGLGFFKVLVFGRAGEVW